MAYSPLETVKEMHTIDSFFLKKAKNILIHGLCWFLLGSLLYEFYPIGDITKESADGTKLFRLTQPFAPFVMTLSALLIFYINDRLLFPRLFLEKSKNRFKYYVSLLLLLATVALLQYAIDSIFAKNLPLSERAIENRAVAYYADTIGFTLTGIVYLCAVLFSVGISFIKSWLKDQKLKKRITEEKIKTENQLLKAQVNPHFLFNILNTFFSLAQKHNAPEIEEGVATLSDMFRYALSSPSDLQIPLNEEIDYLRSYLYLQKLRFEEDNDIVIDFKVTGEPNGLKIHQLLLITFIENAFKHGISTKGKSKIDIQINCSPEFNLKVVNTIGSTNDNGESFGLGLKNVKKRLVELYPDLHRLVQQRRNHLFFTELKLRLQ